MKRSTGFSLIEMAVVLLIVTLLLGSLLVPFATQVEERRKSQTRKVLEDIQEALIGYAASHRATVTGLPYLPCPDVDDDGLEDRDAAGRCQKQSGLLPWATLAMASADAWGNRFHYAVDAAFSSSQTGFDANASGTLKVCEQAKPNGAPDCARKVAVNVPAVVLSYGPNGRGAVNANGGANPPPQSADEVENTDADPDSDVYVARVATAAGAPAGEFDDIVVWLSPHVLFARLIAAQRLP